ncbi:BLUF domain-containing protein [Oceanospirillum sediminis]|uniref:BLUF domain-containing protein n=1 Tax=Oceanospirillum sediminis TaxID=2760088 RepID=A0A839IRX3_9GAMM|nr:BLUF domain-containing protein [Oceanospirillum sediminis]MBB1487681.1 BLUF domain-containing protein [Oceanospirillum sediminis]
MYLVRLIYCSTSVQELNINDIEQIIHIAKENNARHNVSGLLCFNRKYFLQCLEGSRTNVNKTYRSILNDPRHNNIVLLEYNEITQREFQQWSIGYVSENSITKPLCMKYSGHSEFTPYEMRGQSCLNMMLELRDSVIII